jgi:polyphosphate kinase 2 (PPK2 family)
MKPLRLADYARDENLDREVYASQLEALQHRMELIQAAYINQNLKAIIAVEGWDAGGKGGLITRLVGTLDPRFVKVWSIAAPSKAEIERHYLWRFWQKLPGNREIAVFDRSWYGRVLVERVDGLTPEPVWRRAYDEINAFEALHAADGMRIVKLFLHVTAAEQDKRLKERLETPWKRWKTGLDDYHNRSQRGAYVKAYEEMFDRTSTRIAPWTVIAGNDKKAGRIKGLQTVVETLSKGVDLSYPPVDPAVRKVAEAALGVKLA